MSESCRYPCQVLWPAWSLFAYLQDRAVVRSGLEIGWLSLSCVDIAEAELALPSQLHYTKVPTDSMWSEELQRGWPVSRSKLYFFTHHPLRTVLLFLKRKRWSDLDYNYPLVVISILYIAVVRSHASNLMWGACYRLIPRKMNARLCSELGRVKAVGKRSSAPPPLHHCQFKLALPWWPLAMEQSLSSPFCILI